MSLYFHLHFDFHLHFAATAPNGPPVPPDRPRSQETERLGVIRKNEAHQGDDDDREEEDKKVRDDIELTSVEERRPSQAC